MKAMTRQKVIDGLLNRWDFYTDLVKENGWRDTWYESAQEILCTAMWIDAITPDQYQVLSDMLWKDYFGEPYAE